MGFLSLLVEPSSPPASCCGAPNHCLQTLNPSSSAPIPFNMEDALAPPPLAPSPTPIGAAVLTRRRSHLDSASYRTLSHLFSHCLHLQTSSSEASASPEAELAAANPTSVDSGDSPQVPKDADFDPRTEDVDKKAASSGSPSRHTTCAPARDETSVANPTGDQGEAEALQVGLEGMGVLVESTCGKPGAVSEEPVVARLDVEDEALKSMEACLDGEIDGSAVEAVGNDNGQLLLYKMMTDFTGPIDDIGVGPMPALSSGVSEGELQNSKKFEESKQLGGETEEERPACNSDCRQFDGGGFEEGEIEGELQDLDAEESDSDDEEPGGDSVSRGSGEHESCGHETWHRNAHLTPEIKGNDCVLNIDVDVRNHGQISITRDQAVSYDEVLDWNETPLPDNE
ncbi:hypothetical protein QOZ80_1AG0021590 [Eleusine coracana subsp. coracana]|nr:hypothetical protein QOZ80_1AG0021590 [Eleusine coracana subsp. coracana]